MRNFKIDGTRASVLTNEVNQQIADLTLSGSEVSILAQVRNAYWELSYARYAVEAAERSLELASKLVGDNRSRVEIGTLAPIDVVQAQAEEANRKQQLVTAQANLRNNELALKRLIVSGTDDELWRAVDHPDRSADRYAATRRSRGRGRQRTQPAHRPDDDEEEPRDHGHQSAQPGEPDQAAARSDRDLEPRRPRRRQHSAARPDHR